MSGEGGPDLVYRQRITTFEDLPKWQVNALDVDLPHALLPGQSYRLRVVYGGYLVGNSEVGMLYVKDQISREFTILREDALAFPVVGVPSLRANRAAGAVRLRGVGDCA